MSNSPAPSTRQWTAPQRAAIEHTHGDLLVSAAAGSGKTAVLAERCARLVTEPPPRDAPPSTPRTGVDNLLVLTFTEAAAAEMRGRIADAIRAKLRTAPSRELPWLRRQVTMVDRAAISTLHAFCMRILRQHFHEANVDPAFDIIDEEEARLLQDDVLNQLLVQWHDLPAKPAPNAAYPALTAAAFTEFFEAFAQGRQSMLFDLILGLHRLLASTADPEAYIAKARGLYGSGAESSFSEFHHHTLRNRVRLARLATQRAADDAGKFTGNDQMATALRGALATLDRVSEILAAPATDYAAIWQQVRNTLDFAWPPRMKTIKEIPDFAGLKERVYEGTKKLFKELTELFTPDPNAMLRDLRELARPLETLLALTQQFDKAFIAAKRADNRLDFSDLERLAYTLLTQPQNSARDELRQRYHYLLVDEFQDINPLQEALLEALRNPAAPGQGNLFVVGDIKQSIYAFRLAEPQLFLERERKARADQSTDPAAVQKFISLQHNFRTHPPLLETMNRIFEKIITPEVVGIDYRNGHDLQPPPGTPQSAAPATNQPVTPKSGPSEKPLAPFIGTPVELHLAVMSPETTHDEDEATEPRADAPAPDAPPDDEADETHVESVSASEQEARLVAARVAALLSENRGISDKHGALQPLRPRHIAILLRTMKNKAMIYARALAERGVPVHADLSSGFFDTQEVKDALALLQVLDNPQQDIPLATVLLGPFGNFTHDDLALIRLAFDRKEVPFCQATALLAAPPSPADTEAGATAPQPLSSPPAELVTRLSALFAKLARWRELLRARPLHEGLAEIFAESKVLAYVAGLNTGQQRVANLQLLHQRALKFATFKKQGLHRFLRFIEKLREQEAAGDIGEAPVFSEASDVVRIISIHKSKGLEFPVVFVSGLGGKLRLSNPGPVLRHRDLGIGLYANDIERNISYPSAAALRIAYAQRSELRAEELRLLYVAMTRARECLILTGHVNKASDLEKWREPWQDWRSPLPEDMLLKGTRPLDWLMPALAADKPPTPGADLPVQVTVHAPEPVTAASLQETPVSETVAHLLAAEPLPATSDPRVDHLIKRVTAVYPHEAATRQPAVQTVTYLKSLADDRASAGEISALAPSGNSGQRGNAGQPPRAQPTPSTLEFPATPEDTAETAKRAEAAKQRGIATHRILQIIDLAAATTPAALDTHLQALIAAQQLTADEAARADLAGIRWFLFESQSGRRLSTLAQQIAADLRANFTPTRTIRREIPFTWLANPSLLPTQSSVLIPQSLPADLPTIRGVIDLLLANPSAHTAEIFDYKTDSPFLWQSRLDDYRRQMQYYLAAASEILAFPVTQTTLIFLAPHTEVVVTHV
jgi:ATP-dependent helicase/nuclease subunit A